MVNIDKMINHPECSYAEGWGDNARHTKEMFLRILEQITDSEVRSIIHRCLDEVDAELKVVENFKLNDVTER